jgi:hypothetical protein
MRRTIAFPSLVRCIAVIVMSGLITALLLLASGAPQRSYAAGLDDPSPTVTPTPPNPTQAAQPTQQSSSDANCPGVDINDKTPIITICSPRFRGNAEGPAGTHITLLGRNFPSPPTAFYLLQVPSNFKAPSVNILNDTCAVVGNFKCFPVQDMQSQLSQIQNTQSFTLNFDWKFPVMEVKKDYFIILSYLSHNDKNELQAIPVVSNISFTLRSPNVPCINISFTPNPKPGCSPKASTPPLSAGSKIYIHGENWYPGGNIQIVHIQLKTCQPSCQQGDSIPLVDATPDTNGAFTSKVVTLDKNWNGYQLMASNSVPNNVTPQQHLQMQADNALTFGHIEKGDTALSLNIVLKQGSSDSPLLPVLALIPALLSFLLYIIGQRQHNNLSTAATQRISVTHDSRSQPLPPISRHHPDRRR